MPLQWHDECDMELYGHAEHHMECDTPAGSAVVGQCPQSWHRIRIRFQRQSPISLYLNVAKGQIDHVEFESEVRES